MPVRVRECSKRAVLEPCSLPGLSYQMDTYIGCEHRCHYCYALNQSETEWAEEVLVHADLGETLSRELDGVEPQTIYLGWNSDPYQPSEETYRQTRTALELLAERGFSACVLTKSDLVVRDIDVLAGMPNASAGVSVAFQDEPTRRLFERGAPPNEKRIAALQSLREAGIRTYALICPVLPYITDVASLTEQVACCADAIWVYRFKVERESDRNWQNVAGILDDHFPRLREEYERIAFSDDDPYWAELRRQIEGLRVRTGLDLQFRL